MSKGAGTFQGTITGGNARGGSAAQVFTYAFDVPKGTPDIGAGVTLADDPGIQLEGVLVDPNDETQSIGTQRLQQTPTATPSSPGPHHAAERGQPGARALAGHRPGRQPGHRQGARARIHAGPSPSARPRSRRPGCRPRRATTLPQGQSTTAQVTVTNTGIAPVNVQLDPRTDAVHNTPLTSPFGSQDFQLPDHAAPTFLVPPGTTSLTATAVSDVPAVVELTAGRAGHRRRRWPRPRQEGQHGLDRHGQGEAGHRLDGRLVHRRQRDRRGRQHGRRPRRTRRSTSRPGRRTSTRRSRRRRVTSGRWCSTRPADIGTPVTIQPGRSATVTVSIKPTGKVGSTVHGVLNVIVTAVVRLPELQHHRGRHHQPRLRLHRGCAERGGAGHRAAGR